ncbi:calcium-activated chloride channel-domain-containing protein [Fusarium redolens]|uniref:Calcium-activated chloride channel-domain-containing protein n=1 Tax=Fusarium redolens TaxID=48865 RepID=A0A9P9GMR1_FUSRE|nr:calcium-activated chloride channel-domain-containing protein [Fusarium redolens]KAH7240819.1 calcium-activated chloride channel-domain-containing protein [Fusarium redolens]
MPSMGFEDKTTYNDKYVVLYDFGDTDHDTAIQEFKTLVADLEETGFDVEVRAGYEQSLLVFAKAPRELLGNAVYKSRVKDWLYGITPNHPGGDKNTVVDGAYEAEDILSVYHIVNWSKDLGGAGITPGTGKWENVKAIFPIHNSKVNQSLLKYLSRKFFLTNEDIDQIRNLHGSKVAFYFAFIQAYLLFLTFPAITGVIAWLWLPRYSLAYGILTSVWCTVFLEYWKIQEIDLSLRWNVKGIHHVKVNRPQFKYDYEYVDEGGRKHYVFPRWKKVVRQLLQIPFLIVAFLALGITIIAVFTIEILISETYAGPYKDYLEYLPTILLAVSLPYITSALEDAAEWMTEFENHRTADLHEMSLTQKVFVLNMFTNYLPIFLTAFIYIPFGGTVVPKLENFLSAAFASVGKKFVHQPFHLDADRLRNEVIALTVTGQLSGFFEENIVPMLKHKFSDWYRDYRRARSKGDMLLAVVKDDPEETAFLSRVRNEAILPKYNVQDDIAEIVLQFGYLALFSPVWPIIPMGFLINNWIELRSDFAKISLEHQRPAPVRSDGIGPWIYSLEALTWLGSICTAAIVHLFSADKIGNTLGNWATLPVTVFISEHVLLLLRSLVRFTLQQIGSERIREDYNQRYANRVKYLEELETKKQQSGLAVREAHRERRKSVLVMERDPFWTKQVHDGASELAGVTLIQQVKRNEEPGDQEKKD